MASATKAHNYKFALEKYMLLQEQHAELSKHLQQIRHRKQSTSSISPRSSSPSSYKSSSPKLHSRSSERQPSRAKAPCRGWSESHRDADTLDTIVDEKALYEISAEEPRLFDVNESIKRVLTELLNCETIRGDNSMRMWAQRKLMETEKELRSGRRRRSSRCTE
ncbi:uncharacterized protein FOBCDRAFT_321563 [Fusarium oxysporum Fo47]|uniref:Uncharacterized protein n=1 Tax=Fusarium oxysporum Fo47 TaxID=660027 RepID=W9JAH9_FUSOX|nr:uncharacterized protein FOBCDRAFT_321563 [Fusarium oxysporum Fo47]EWZ28851.1 hypothetical protein FOZG_17413 [Fusarium oxysporum Fo47]QKD57791.1 hypothetical protein FOBCDRAFT_321563 [Fusarium oxysporum Fo47]